MCKRPSPGVFLNGAAAWRLTTVINRIATVVASFEFTSQPSPRAAVAGEQIVCSFWSPRTGGIEIQFRHILLCMPRFLDGIDERRRFFDLVATRKQRGVATHRIEQQTFVRLRARFTERCPVVEIHLDRLDTKTCAGDLGMNPQR